MTCRTVKMGQIVAIVCDRRGRRVRMCSFKGCKESATVLCDWRGCDRPTCRAHAASVGENRDFCFEHARQEELL